MPELPEGLVHDLCSLPDFDAGSFRRAHLEPPPVSIRLNPQKIQLPAQLNFVAQNGRLATPPLTVNRIPWSRQGYYLSQRPSFTFDPLFHAGLGRVAGPGSDPARTSRGAVPD